MRQWIEENKRFLLPVGMIILIIIPIIIYGLSAIPLLPGCNNDWVGFWGGYLGAIIGGVITLYVLVVTIGDSKEGRAREEKIVYFKDLINITVKAINEANACVLLFIHDQDKIMTDQLKQKLLDLKCDVDIANIWLRIMNENNQYKDISSLRIQLVEFYNRFLDMYDIPKVYEGEKKEGLVYTFDENVVLSFHEAAQRLSDVLTEVSEKNIEE